MAKRFNHVDGVAPHNGIVAVMENSLTLQNDELNSKKTIKALRQREKADNLLNIKTPIRMDCRIRRGKHFNKIET